jgi:glycosyltransferase involved in cell wall biosynthesis
MKNSETNLISNLSTVQRPTLAIVIPCFNEEASIPTCARLLVDILNSMIADGLVSEKSYLYFVDDGSTDASWSLLSALHAEIKGVRALRLSRNFGHQSALLAGLMAVNGRCDAAISIDADLQQDPLAMPSFVKRYIAGAEVVFGVRNDRASDSWFKKTTALGFYWIMKIMGVTIIPNHADYRLLGGRAIAVLAQHDESNIFLRAICAQLGFRNEIVYFDVKERSEGTSKYSLFKMLKLAVNGITSFSAVPLRAVAVLGFLIFGASLGMGGYVIFRSLVIGDTVPGWASTTLPIYLIGGIQILCMGIIGEYTAQIFNAVKRRPRYICERELF